MDTLKKIAPYIAIALGLVFLASGFIKLLDTRAFSVHLMSFRLPAIMVYLSPLVPPFEIMLGVSLFAPSLRRPAALTALIALALFTLTFYYGTFFGSVSECRCFGSLHAGSGLVGLTIRNLALAALGFGAWKALPKRETGVSWRNAAYTGLAAVFFMLAVMSANQPFVMNTPLKRGQDATQTGLAKLIDFQPDKRYLAVFYSLRCIKCIDSLENVKAFAETGKVDQVYAFALGRDADLAEIESKFQLNFETKLMRVRDFDDFARGIPTAYYIKNNRIHHIEVGSVMSPFTFEFRVPGF